MIFILVICPGAPALYNCFNCRWIMRIEELAGLAIEVPDQLDFRFRQGEIKHIDVLLDPALVYALGDHHDTALQ